MEAKKIKQIEQLMSKDFTESAFANILRKIDFEFVHLALMCSPEVVDRDIVTEGHFYLHQLADILDPKN
jgi:hypothetical protein